MAGELSDGAISWLCPVAYLESVAKPALVRGGQRAGRPAPPLVAHVFVAPRTDRATVRDAARRMLEFYATVVYYQRMFADSGYPLGPKHAIPDATATAPLDAIRRTRVHPWTASHGKQRNIKGFIDAY